MRLSVKRRQPVEIQKQVIHIKLTTFVRFSLQLLCACVQCYLNLNSLLVKRQIDNPSPGAVTGGN